jgi:hypothetical protein
MIEPDINQQMARFAPSQNPTDPGFDAIEKAVAGMSGVPMPAPEPVDMDIDRAVQDIAAQRNQDMASSLMAASEVNPDEAAQADVLGKRFGVGQDIALRNMAEMRRQAMVQDTERMDLLRKDPVLARYIADREFAAQASDDVGVLSMLRPLVLEAAMLQTQGGLFRVVGAGYERGAIVSERGDIGAKAMAGFAEPGDFDRAKELTQRMQALGQQGLVGSAAEMIAQNVSQLRTIGTATVGGAALGSLAGPAGTVAGGALGASAGVMAGTGTMEAGNLYLDMREEGVSDDAAIPAAVAGGFLNGLIEVVGMKIASAPFKALASKVIREEVSKAIAQPTMRSALIAAGKAYGLQVGGEAAEEGLQEIVGIASEEIAKAADGIDSETSLRDATGRVIEAFAYGGMASALLGGIGPGANLVVNLRRASATQRQQDFFNGLAENRKESKLAQRNPQGYERFLAAQAQDTPAETIYIDAATARDVLAQSGTTTAQLEELLPGIRERLEQAVETGGDVTIPTSQFGARLANTELGNALLPHMRLSPDAMSATEAQAFAAERQAVVEEARTILAAKQEADAAFVAEAQQVEDEAFEQVRAVGQFTDIEARTIAKLRQAMVVVDAAEAGMTPAQYQRERGVPLQVRGEGMAVPVAPSQAVAPLTDTETNPLQTALGELSARAKEHNARVASDKLEKSNPIAKAGAAIKDSVRRINDAINANDEVEIAHQAWRLRNRLDNHRQDMDANTLGAVEGMLAKLDAFMQQRGIEIHNPIGEKYVDGWVEVEVVSWEEVDKRNPEPDTIKQTIRPIIRRNGQVASRGQVIATYATEADLKRHEEKEAQRKAEMRAKLEAKVVPWETSAAQEAGGTLEQAATVDASGVATPQYRRAWHKATTGQPITVTTWRSPGGTTAAQLTDFARERMARDTTLGNGWYGARDRDIAEIYGTPKQFEVTLQNPFVFSEADKNFVLKLTNDELQRIRNAGYDGIIVKGVNATLQGQDRSHLQVVAFNPETAVREVSAPLNQAAKLDADYLAAVERGDMEAAQRMVDEASGQPGQDAVTRDEQGNIVPLSRRFDITSPKLLDQAATLDADYLAAVERGDMEAAQRMVDEAASAQGYTVEAFHGTPEGGFTEFNESPSGLFFTNKPSVAQGYTYFRNPWLSPSNNAAVYRTRLRMQNPLVIDASGARNNNIPFPGREYQRTVFGQLPDGAVSVEEAARLAFESGYDGIIINNVMDSVSVDDKTRSTVYVVPAKEQAKLADPVTYDEQGNIVPLSRRFDITSPKLFEQAAAAPRLMAVHNLSADNLAFAERMGGLAVPSIGVVTEQAGGVEGFGEITLIGSREMADPSTSRVFEADAYSARFPQPEWPKVPVAKADKFVQRLREVSKKYDDSSIVDVTFDGMVNNPDASKISNYWMSSSAAMALFLRDKGIEIEPRMRVPSTLSGLDWNEIDALRPVYNAVNQNQSYDDMEASPEYAALQEAYANAIRAKYAPIADEMPAGRVEKYATEFGPGTMSRLQRDMQQTDRNKVSYSKTRDALETAIQPYQAEFKTWVDSTIREQFGAPFIRDGKLKKPYTLGNIVDAMTSAKVKGEEKGMTFGAGAARAAASEEFVDLEQMREAASTAIVDPEKYAEESKKSAVLLEAYRNAMADYSTLFNWRGQIDTWAALDGSMRAIARYGNRKRKSEKAMRDALRREGFDVSKMPPELIDQAIEAASALYTAPVPYFEAKPQRAVGLGEFKGAVIPSNASAETRSILERNNIPFVEYGSEQTRTADVRKFVDLLERGGKGVFFQAAAGPARGGFDPRTLNVLVGKGGDVSTLAHELIHLRVAEYLRMARGTTPPARVMDDLDTLFVFMGVKGATPQERLDNYETMTIDQRRPLEEKVTYNFEIYLYEGKAPSVELRGVFDRLAAWMRRVYKSIRDDLNAIYRREFGTDLPILTPEVRSVFDRMLASEEQIKRQEAISGMKGLFQTQAESGMGDAEWAAYQAMQQEATDAAVTDLNTASMRQLQWLGNARARILRDLQKKHEAKRKEVTAEVAATVKVEPVYRAMTYLRYGRFVDTDGAEVEVEGTHRLDIEKVRAMYAGMPSAESVEPIRATGMAVPANVRPDITPLGTGKYGMLGKDGLDPDVVAETFGYGSGDEMVRALLAAKPMKEAVAERTDAEMLRRFGEMNTPAALEAEVQKALHNEARARFVAVELRHIAKATQPVRVMLEAAKQIAADMISDMTVREVRPGEFVAAESRAARDADRIQRTYGITEPVEELVQRYGADRQQALIRAKRAQLYQNQLAAEALRVKEYVDKQVKYLRGVLRDSNVKRMGAAAADQIAGLLERFEVAQVSLKRLDERRTMAKYLADLEAAGVVPDIAEEITDEARRVNYKELKVSEFRDLVDAVRQIEHIGKNEQKMRLAEERAAFEEVRDEIVTRIRAVGKVRELQIDPRTPLTGIGRTAAFLRGFAAQHLKAASIARILDGGKEDGPLWNTIIRTANDASDMETRMRAEASLKLAEILKPVFALGNMGGKGMFFPSIGRSLNREARISIALNLGNDGNRQRLLDGEGWTMEKLQPVLESLTEAEWMAVQQVWDFIDGYRPEIAAKERRLYGKEPTWVTPVPFTVRTSDGKEVVLQGGYYPVKYDPVASDRVATVDAAEDAKRELQGAYTAATTRRSFVKARAKEVRDRPILYTLDAAFSGVNDVIHDLSWHEWLISTNRLLRDTQFANAVRETRGPEFLKQLRDWSKDNATGARGQQVAGESVLSWLRQGISASGLGFNVVSAAMQVTGFNQSIVRIGAKYVGQGIVQFSTSPFESSKMVAEKSSFMAERGRTQFREINEIKNRVRGQTEVARRVTAGTYFLMMNMQRSVDIPTWLGAYQKALDAGKDDARAVALADQAVRDSQGSGLVSDLAAVERGGPAMKLFTVFYSYMNTVYNMTAVQTMTARSKGKLAADYAMLLVVPVVLGYAIKSVIQPDAGEDELDPEALARKLAAEELSYLMGTMVIVREFGGAAQLVTGAEGARMGYGGPAGLRAVGEVYGLATQAGQLEFDRAFRRAAINTLGAFTGLPSAQVNRTIDGIEALVEGEVTGPTAVLAPLTGVQR